MMGRQCIAAALLWLAAICGAEAQSYPTKSGTVIVPFAPGGANDVVVRAIQQPLSEALGQPIIVENRGGAGGSVGAGVVARARPDGYTLLMAATGFVVNSSLYDKVQYDPLKDFDQVAELTTFPVIYTVRPDLGVKTLAELIALAKARPGALNYSTPGAGTLPHLAAELLKLHTGIDMVHIPYAGAAPAAQALLSKTVDVASTSITVAKPQIEAGSMIGLAVSGAERWPELPDVPTVAEAGVPAALADTWQGIMVPAGTPKEIIDRLATALVEVMRRPDVRERLLHAGFYSTGRGPAEFHRRIVEELPKWKDVIQKARITAP
jgi:tripartite-type tricarboxylate transporter receptor subunit TctC